jgi:LPS-assembly lipoprotein
MSSFNAALPRRCLLLLFAFALAGCGFRPLYGPRSARDWDPDLAAIKVDPIPDRPGQVLALALRENLNPAGKAVPAKWRLQTTLTIARSDLGIQRNATATSSEITVSASFVLVDAASGKPVYSNASRAISDFNQLTDAYATQVAADDARDRALQQVAEEMTMRMAIFMRQFRANAAAR